MSYTINNYDGTFLTTINDGTLDSTTSLELPGPNYVGYGRYLNENLVYLLQSFAGNTAPAGQNLQGQLWFNKSNQTLNVFTSQGYLPVSGIIVSSTQPLNANPGNTWFSTTTNQYSLYDGTSWQLIGPIYTKAQGVSGAIPVTLNDGIFAGVTHNVVQIQYGNSIIAILSADAPFQPTPAIPGFNSIVPGLNINSTIGSITYSNSNVAAYMPSYTGSLLNSTTIQTINSTLNVFNANIGTLFLGNATTQANLGAYQNTTNANVGTLFLGNATTQANLGAYQNTTNANVGTLFLGNALTQANLGTYQNTTNANIGTLFLGNATTQANLGTYQNTTNANIGTLFLGNALTQANLGTYQNTTNANIGTLFLGNALTQANLGTYQNTTNANIGAFYNYANTSINTIGANIGTLFLGNALTQANLGTYQNTTNANVGTQFNSINTINANIGAYHTWANANAAAQATSINSLYTNANANTAAYLTTTTGNISAGNLLVTGNVYSRGNIALVSNLPRNVYVNNFAPNAGQGNIGDIWYQY
jgi:hypothetical protein